MEQLELYVPKREDLWFRQRMMADPDTMGYNANWDVSYDGYHRDTGCIDFPEVQWTSWLEDWTDQAPERFYAYIRRSGDGAYLGEVNFHHNPERDWYDMGIVLHAPYRGMGYSVPALKLLLEEAFSVWNVNRLHNDFEVSRNEVAAWKTHLSAGFRDVGILDGFRQMMITKEDYLTGMVSTKRGKIKP